MQPIPGGSPDWGTGIFSCFDDTSGCCDAICCGPCQIARHCEAVEGRANTQNTMYCLGFTICGYAALFAIPMLRSKIRERFGIQGSCPGDWCCGCCLPGCAVCQHHRELTRRNFWPGGSCFQSAPPTIMS